MAAVASGSVHLPGLLTHKKEGKVEGNYEKHTYLAPMKRGSHALTPLSKGRHTRRGAKGRYAPKPPPKRTIPPMRRLP